MRKVFVILVCLFFFSCDNKNDVIHYFDLYTKDNQLFSRNSMLLTFNPKGDDIYKVSVEGLSGDNWYYEDFYEKYSPAKGIYRKFDGDEYTLCYRFDSTLVQQKVKSPEKSMFLYPNIILSDKKTYSINGKSYTVFAFAENEGSIGILSYYLESFGFFAYDLNNNYYLLCRRASEYTGAKKKLLGTICDSLVKDTCFFSIYRFNKNNPCLREILKNIPVQEPSENHN